MIDAQMADKRAMAIIEKYRGRTVEDDVSATPPEWLGELQSDIANAINAVVNEMIAEMMGGVPEPVKPKRATTHMPATGTHKRG